MGPFRWAWCLGPPLPIHGRRHASGLLGVVRLLSLWVVRTGTRASTLLLLRLLQVMECALKLLM